MTRRQKTTLGANWSAFRLALLFAVACTTWSTTAWGQAFTAGVSSPNNIKIKLEQIANIGGGLIPIDGAAIPGDSKLYVGTYVAGSASIRVVDPVTKTISGTPFLSFSGSGAPINGQGLQGLTFSPNFNDNTKPGYRKFYTYESETGPGAGNVMFAHPEVSNPGNVGVLREWTANAAGTARDTAVASRVVFSFGTPGGHMGGGVKFGPDGYLYLSTGDGGGNGNGNSGAIDSSTDGFTGRNPTGTATDVPVISNGQDFTNVLGKVIRIDPYTTNADGSPRATPADATAKTFSGSTRYFIPNSNPFVGNPQNVFFTPIGPVGSQTPVAPLGELFALGFRNPWKMSFDKNAAPGAGPFVADVGSHDREEIAYVEGGNNYGWPYREGDVTSPAATGRPLVSGNLPYLKQTSPGVFAQYDLDPTLSDPAQMSGPMVRLGTQSVTNSANLVFFDRPGSDYNGDMIYGYQYGDGSSVTGGFVYRGAQIPELAGMYVLGVYQQIIIDATRDVSISPATSGGSQLFYVDPAEAATFKTVRTFNFLDGFGINSTRIAGTNDAEGDLLSIAQGDDGELYAMFRNGDVKRLVGPPAGDFDKDFDVDADDLNDPVKGWKVRFGVDLDGQDFLDWQRNLGVGLPASANGGAVPEPGAATLAAAALVFVVAATRCRRPRGRTTR